MAEPLTPAQEDQLLALLEQGATSKGLAQPCDGSQSVLAILECMGLLHRQWGRLRIRWSLTAAGEARARQIIQERIHG